MNNVIHADFGKRQFQVPPMNWFTDTEAKYIRIMESGEFTENQVKYFRKLINGAQWKRHDAMAQRRAEKLVEIFYGLMPEGGYRLTAEQQDKGLNYLRTRKGLARVNAFMKPATGYDRAVLAEYSHFTFTGLFDSAAYYGGGWSFGAETYAADAVNWMPVYRCHAANGDWFDYAAQLDKLHVVGRGSAAPIRFTK